MSHFINKYSYLTKSKGHKLVRLIKPHENILTLWLPGIGSRIIASHLCSQTLFPKLLKSIYQHTVFLPINLSLSKPYLERQLGEVLGEHTKKTKTRKQIKDVISSGKMIYFVIEKFDKTNIDFLEYIFSLRNIDYKNIRYILFSEEKEIQDKDQILIDTIYSQNIVYIAYFEQEEALEWLDINAKKHKVKLRNSDKKEIIEFSGGVPAILRNFLRGLSKYSSMDEVVQSVEMIGLLKKLFNRFSEREQHVLRTYQYTQKLPPYYAEIAYLKKHNLIYKDNHLRGKWIEYHLAQEKYQVKISIDDRKIVFEDIEINSLLSENEEKILLKLLKSEKVVTRENIAQLVWEDESVEKYSEWAIDQIVSRLRKKLDKAGIGGRIIKTKKKRGYIIVDAVVSK